ncbi:hypothetical protein [Aquamicrobium zhengzhouense]|uniref:Uncharacterized protein n=1 Tax=Aquamicrobium zhengzhouense TaxID=2781738 RepID=A0ABS0SAC2_9HYPH|nr:hypothetical protein [Aquamicrobium zhengzhouense]MBI1620176.1 hypothetical protein [Aquamicrobium zhengzhouense]
MGGLLDWLKLALGAVLGAAVISAPVYLYGKAEGRQIERAASLSRSVEALRERNATDDQVRKMDGVALCRALGGMPDECASLGL